MSHIRILLCRVDDDVDRNRMTQLSALGAVLAAINQVAA
jgi:hypothetical protein